ncbi:MAG: flagellar basal-body rod protein FlgF [Alphaproteobacteria bacterium]|nr:flagellar basal-body rod protein FlgF [Alphaproteobacteria bacterium]
MENSMYLGLSRQMVLRTNMNIIANNVANMNTPGYRGQNTLFKEYVSDPRGADDPLSFVYDYGQYQDSKQGPLSPTSNPLDVALNGPGYMKIQAPGGQTAYTRAGNFQIRQDGTLVTSRDHPVLSNGGAPIVIPQNAGEISIDDTGRIVTATQGEVGQIGIAEFENIQNLTPQGDNLYTTDAAPLPPTKTKMKQGYIEGSNVEGVLEMTRMIETLRDYQSVQRLMDSENERLRSAIRKLSGSQS